MSFRTERVCLAYKNSHWSLGFLWENSHAEQTRQLIPVGKIIDGLSGPVQALRETPPPARRGFTLADQ